MFKDENDALMESFLERTFYAGWRNPKDDRLENFRSLEIQLNAKCNLACKYCYLNKFGDQLFPKELDDEETILRNLDALLRWIKENDFYPKIEFFTGESFVQPISFKILNRIIDELGGDTRRGIVIPTNFTFLLNDELTRKVENLLKKAKEGNVDIFLSASFDGKHCEGNRPFRHNVESVRMSPARVWTQKLRGSDDLRDDAYYDKTFKFAKKWGFGFHPMVYSDHIENWKDNFLWFQKQFEKVEYPWDRLYLLEVRNVEWTDRQLQEYMKFIKFLWRWSYKKCKGNVETLFEFIFSKKGFNILSSTLTTVGRGIGCSIQGTVFVRLGDLAIVPCHRTCYEPLNYGRFKVESGISKISGYTRKDGSTVEDYFKDKGDKIVGVEAKNVELMIGIYSMDSATFPYCESCMINSLCNKGCLGSQYEVTGDLFTPIPTVCKLYHAKVKAMVEVFMELGIFEVVMNKINLDKQRALDLVRKMLVGGEL